MRSVVVWLLLIVALGSCSETPSLDSQRMPRPREYPRRRPLAGVSDTKLDTVAAMYASAELLRSIAPLNVISNDRVFEKVKTKEWLDAINVDSQWLARYNVEMLDFASGMGIPLADAPARIAACTAAAGLQTPPMRNPLPIVVPFLTGDPHFTTKIDLGDPNTGTPPDYATMRFDPKRMERFLGPGSIGMTLWAEIELARYLLAPTLSGDKEAAASTKAKEDAFEGLLALTLASEKAPFLRRMMQPGDFYPWESQSWFLFGFTFVPDPKGTYFPHRFTVTDATNSANCVIHPVDFVSHLGDLSMVLLAASELAEISAPDPGNPFAKYFGPGGPLPAGTHDAAVDLAKTVLTTIVGIHDAPFAYCPVSFVSEDQRGFGLLTGDAAILLVALDQFSKSIEPLEGEESELIRKLASWLVEVQYDDGTYTSAYYIETRDAVEPRWFGAGLQGLAIRALLVAFEKSGDFVFRRAAVRAQRELDDEQWLTDKKIYRSEDLIASGMNYSRYSATILGGVAAGLRELTLVTHEPAYATRYAEFISGLSIPGGILHTGLLMSELAQTGEKSPDARDADTDGILNAPFADGPFGVAPVFARELVIETP